MTYIKEEKLECPQWNSDTGRGKTGEHMSKAYLKRAGPDLCSAIRVV